MRWLESGGQRIPRGARALAWALLTATVWGAEYEVGPGKTYSSIGLAPLAELQPGDVVLIHWREEPYREKFVLCAQGSAEAPIAIRGVPGPDGQLPVIDGDGAVTAPGLNYWNEERSVIKIGGANRPADRMPRHLVIENLDIRSARPGAAFTNDDGRPSRYVANAAALMIEKGESITVRNCVLSDSGNGLFVASSEAAPSRDIRIEGCYLFGNGNVGSAFEHNAYTAALGIVYEANRFGPLRAGANGNNLKDRSAGLVVRYNWIEGGNRQLDLVDGEDSAWIRDDPRYRATHVYGNILIEPDGAGNRQIVHYGGDSAGGAYRKGVLYFYNNTIVSLRRDRTTLFRLSTNEETCWSANNVFYAAAAGNTLSLLDASGGLRLRRNWFKPGWVTSFGTFGGAVDDDGSAVTGDDPGFRDADAADFRPVEAAPVAGASVDLPEFLLPGFDVSRQYVRHRGAEERKGEPARALGAFAPAPSAPPEQP